MSLPERYVRGPIWKHNSFAGHIRMARVQMNSIATSETVSEDAIWLARRIEQQLEELKALLEHRVDRPEVVAQYE